MSRKRLDFPVVNLQGEDESDLSEGEESIILELTEKQHSKTDARTEVKTSNDEESLSEGEEEIFEELTSSINSSFTRTCVEDANLSSKSVAESTCDANPTNQEVSEKEEDTTDCLKRKASRGLADPPFVPGDHVYRWHKITGIPAYHHHAIVMDTVWDELEECWILHVSDFSNISLRDATAAAAAGSKCDKYGGFPQTTSSQSSPSMISNPFAFHGRKNPRGTWRTYLTRASDGWTKVLYNASLLEQVQNPSAGTATDTDCDSPQVVLARALFLQEYSGLVLDMPYHWVHNNCETAAVWCKTGQWCTLQALCALVAKTAITTQLTATAMLAMPLNVVVAAQPYLIPIAAAYGVLTVGVSMMTMKHTISKWNSITERLNDSFERSFTEVDDGPLACRGRADFRHEPHFHLGAVEEIRQ